MKLDYRRTFFVGLAFMSICSFWQMYDSIIPLILKQTFNINDSISGAVMAADNVLALFMLPLFGALSDRTDTRLGRRTPYIIGGTIAASAVMLLIPFSDNSRSLALFSVSLGLVLISMSIYRSPAVALMPDVTPKPLRSKANAVINLMGAVGGIIALGLIAALVPKGGKPNYMPLFICIAVFMLASVAVLLSAIKEKKLAAEMKGLVDDDKKAVFKGAMPPEVKSSFRFLLASVFLWFVGYNAITTAMSAQILTPIVSGALLQYVGYWTLFPYGTFFVIAAFMTMLFVKHGDSKPELPAKKIEVYGEADS